MYRLRRVPSALVFLVLCATTCALQAQEFRGTLSGHVTDPSGGAVPNASVQAVNNASRQSYSGTTTGAGDYFIPYMLPGSYTVTAKATGFKASTNQRVEIQTGSSPVLNIRLQIGETSETVTVTADAPMLDAENAVQNNVLQTRELENMPLNGRQVFTVLGTTPGSQFLQTQFGASGYSGTRAWDISNNYVLGGGVQGYQQFTLNGSNITQQNNGTGTWQLAPNVDALQEVNVQTTNYDARFGRTSGGIMNMVMKQGTNAFHGNLYDYLENGVMNANNFENNLNGIPTQKVQQNQFGGTFGGPVKKDKIFFFGSFEGYVQNIPFTTLTTVPADYLRPQNGGGVDFTQSGYTIYQPNSTFCSGGGSINNCSGTLQRVAFPNNTIPASQINPIAVKLLNLFPAPDVPGAGLKNNFIANVPDKYRYYQPMVRVDYDTSDKTRWYSLFAYQHGTEFRNTSGFTGPAENGNIDNMRQELMASEDMTHIFSPTFLVDVKMTFSRFQDRSPNGDLNSTVTPESIGLNMPKVPTSSRNLLPEITYNEIYPQTVGNNFGANVYNSSILDVDFTKTTGRHTLHFGGEAGYYQWGTPQSVGRPNGYFNFGTQFTQANPYQRGTVNGVNDGMVLADLLLGYPDGGGVDYNATQWTHFPTMALYAQDNWHVTRRLTVNVGLRYDVQYGLRGHGLNRGLCLTCVNPITNDAVYQANLAAAAPTLAATGIIDPNSLKTVYGGVLFAGHNGQPEGAYDTDYSNIGPRFGFAYQLNPKTVIRGGYGIMYSVGLEGGSTVGYSQSTPYVASNNNNLTPNNNFAGGNPFPNGYVTPLGAAGGMYTGVGNGASFDFPGRRIPRSQQVSLGIQRDLPEGMTLDARFTGNFSNRLRTTAYSGAQGSIWLNGTWTKEMQQKAEANPNLFNSSVPNPYYGVPGIPAGSYLGSNPTIPAVDLTVPWSLFPGPLGSYDDPLGKSHYLAMEILLTKRLSHGVSFRAAYTYSKTMQTTGYINGWPYQDAELLHQIAPYDRTHVFTLSGVYDLPSYKGNQNSAAQRVLSQLASHWVLSNVLTVETGFPQGLPGGFYYNSGHSWTPDGGTHISEWLYNCGAAGPLSCWQQIPSYGLGVLPNRVSTVRQPQVPNLDLSLQRNFPIREGISLQFRADAFNITNSVLFGGADTNPYDGAPVKQTNGSWTGFGTIAPFQNNFPRVMQLSLKLFF
jgi:hypothetical protein